MKLTFVMVWRLAFVTYSYEHIVFDHRKGGWIWHSIYFIALYCGRRKWFIFEQTQMLKLRTVGEDTVNTTAKVKMVRFLPPDSNKTKKRAMDSFHSTSLSVRCGYPRATEIANSKLTWRFRIDCLSHFHFPWWYLKKSYKMTERGMER